MLYAILCYHSEASVAAWSKEHDDAVLTRLKAVRGKLAEEGRMGPAARLMNTTAAVREMAQANDTGGAYEIRPIALYNPPPPGQSLPVQSLPQQPPVEHLHAAQSVAGQVPSGRSPDAAK